MAGKHYIHYGAGRVLFLILFWEIREMIESLEMANWRSHADTRLQFGKGTNLIVGIMGSGKSAVLDAVCYALYGTFPALRRRSISTSDAVRHGEKEARVALEIAHAGKKYRVVRGLRRGERGMQASAKVFEDGKAVESGQERVTAFMEEKLGMDYDLFNRAVYSEQNNISYFLELDAGRRKREMDGLMGLDRFEEVRTNSVRLINRIEGERKALAHRYDGARHGECGKSLEAKRGLLAEEEKKAEGAERELEGKRRERDEAEKRLLEMRNMKERKEKAAAALERGRARAEALEADLEGKETGKGKIAEKKAELREAEAGVERASGEISGLEKEAAGISKSLGELEGRLKAAEKATREREDARKKLEKILDGGSIGGLEEGEAGLEKRIVELGSQAKSLLAEADEIEKYIGGLDGKAECPVCGAELGEGKAAGLKEEKRKEARRKREGAAEIGKGLEVMEKELLELKKSLREAGAAVQKLEGEIEDAGGLKLGLEGKRKEAEALGKELERLGAERRKAEGKVREVIVALKGVEALAEKRKMAEKVRERVKALEKEAEGIRFSEEEYDALSGRVKALLVECERAEGRAREGKRVIGSLREIMGGLERELAAMDAVKKEVEAKAGLVEQLALFRNAVVESQAELRSELVEAINAAMNGIWPTLYPYADYKQLRIAADEQDYVFEVYDGEWRRLEKVASGGEKACLALTLRIALATVLAPEAGMLVLDEPTHNLDRGAVQALAEALESKVPELVQQAFVITHEESLMNSEFARSYRLYRDKGSGGETRAEEA